jgi:hypothetical protein
MLLVSNPTSLIFSLPAGAGKHHQIHFEKRPGDSGSGINAVLKHGGAVRWLDGVSQRVDEFIKSGSRLYCLHREANARRESPVQYECKVRR